jgi:DNA-binding PadR family transcriptional regulator
MSLRYAILGLLSRESLTGYDLTKQFDSTIGFFWSAKHSQIYPELASLTKEGLVTFELVTQTSKPNKKVYTITEAGREALHSWVAEPSDMRTIKDPLLMRIWVVGVVDPRAALKQLREALPIYEKRVAMFKGFEETMTADKANAAVPENTWLGGALALHCGVLQAEAYRSWLVWAIAQLEQVIAQTEKTPAT